MVTLLMPLKEKKSGTPDTKIQLFSHHKQYNEY